MLGLDRAIDRVVNNRADQRLALSGGRGRPDAHSLSVPYDHGGKCRQESSDTSLGAISVGLKSFVGRLVEVDNIDTSHSDRAQLNDRCR